jgi:hypothetical protein
MRNSYYHPSEFDLQDIGCVLSFLLPIVVLSVISSMFLVSVASADTLIVYPTKDGTVSQAVANSNNTYAAIRGAAGNAVDSSTSPSDAPVLATSQKTIANNFSIMRRSVFSFNTSDIPDTATITGATLYVSFSQKTNGEGSPTYGITGGVLGSNTSLAAGDYDGFTDVAYSDTYNAYSGMVANNVSWVFNAAGLANVSKTSYTIIYLRDNWDFPNKAFGGTWSSWQTTAVYAYYVETAGTGQDPRLEITYSTATAPVSSFTCTKNFLRIPNSVTCTDSSTNTPTSWSWNMGDGSAAKTTQNVTYQYTKRGKWGITLNATNTAGSNVTPSATNVKVVGYENFW